MTHPGRHSIWHIGWLLLASAACLSAAEPAATPGRGALLVRASSWTLPAGGLGVTLEQRGVLAGRRLAILLFVDGNQLKRVATTADRTRIRLEMPALAPGRYTLLAKTGSEVAQTEFRVISRAWLAGSVLLAGGGIGLLLVLLLRRHRGQRGHQSDRSDQSDQSDRSARSDRRDRRQSQP